MVGRGSKLTECGRLIKTSLTSWIHFLYNSAALPEPPSLYCWAFIISIYVHSSTMRRLYISSIYLYALVINMGDHMNNNRPYTDFTLSQYSRVVLIS